ncbi:MAG: hypothetical protein IPH00_16560 [Flavobacteriales bacterium]|nr:hypothetical protein [Flavobacteriales bacterium]MBK7247269.1 hypothetical protein [Flavobacteriales bacterium]HQY04121.1 DUF2586 family protein [Flavobacteriales bacterium]
MSFLGPKIIKIGGGLGQQAPSDRNVGSMVIANGYAVATTFPLDTNHELNSVDDAVALGLSAATDANAVAAGCSALTYYHVSEYFRLNPDGKLYVHNGSAVADADIFADDGPADQLMAMSQNSLRFVGVVFGLDPDPGVAYVLTSGFAPPVLTVAAAAQTWAEKWRTANVYVDTVVVEGAWANPAVNVDLKAIDCPQVVVTVACDFGYLEPLAEPGLLRTAAVGVELASIGVRMLSESKGSLTLERYPSERRGSENYSMVDIRKNRWMKVGLSTGETFTTVPQNRRTLYTTNAYSYAGRYEGYPGVYLNADATCTTSTDDYNTVHINRIWNEAARMVRRALIPRINSRVFTAPDGKIAPATLADWDAAAKRQLDTLVAEGEIASYRFVLDPAQDVIAQGKVVTKLRIVPQGIAKEIEGEIGFTNPAQAA